MASRGHAQPHRSDPRTLGRRTLERDHRFLARMLRPGLSVLDVGCGTGAITAGIAKAVGADGYVLGLDRDAGMLETARREHGGIPNLEFDSDDATTLNLGSQFDIVTAARTLQWISDPGLAVLKMREAAKASGLVVALDYNHALNAWIPNPPTEFSLRLTRHRSPRPCASTGPRSSASPRSLSFGRIWILAF